MANNIQELRSLSEKELISMKQQLQEKIMHMRFKSRIERPKNIMEIRGIKRTIARINTLIREAELKLEG
ncbi:large subunit ribosomal protein L29 [Brevinema andersonii]|uniref:Large ribosomal subunit protein uL29 n=1 Tax=Brevinema andersonii TaxID=34097 RepID=A0A1I1D0H2_BREAD|nr:50S ribosomal protein L29 [Brevinema andersonii]SFB68277.1 large subunit ribosomal protein L29 [Brevinema andersonii]